MSKSLMSDKVLLDSTNVIRSYGFSDQSSMIDLLYRVVMTKKALLGKDDDSDTVYRTMQEVSPTLPRFPGDADLFFNIYNTLSPLDERGILSFINVANGDTGRRPGGRGLRRARRAASKPARFSKPKDKPATPACSWRVSPAQH